ncbi:hypothetical protein NQZ68_040721 [Dissostichus eleginoides]|nr:hypothetical protein NQZ68_040721 [Dissostichus eleginoides]
MEFTTRFGLHSQTTRLREDRTPARRGPLPASHRPWAEPRSEGLRPPSDTGQAVFHTPHFPNPPVGRGFGAGLFPLRSPLLRESWRVSPGASPTSAGTPSLPKRHPRVAGPRRNAGSAETESPPAAAHAQRRARRGAPRPDPKTPDVRGGKREFAPTERREDQVARANRTGHPETSALRGTKAAETACDTPAAEKRERFSD